MAATRKGIESANRRQRPRLTSQAHLHHFGLDMETVALKSEKIAAAQLQKNPNEDLSLLLGYISAADEESMELLARFCHGYDINLSPENVVGVACLANSLAMTETHSPNNLLKMAISFFEKQITNSWNNSIRALKSAKNHHHVLRQAQELGLIDYCIETLSLKALEDPRLLGEPLMKKDEEEEEDDDGDDDDIDENEKAYRPPNARRKLFDIDWKSEDLTTLPLKLYAPIIHAMIKRQVPLEYVAANLCQYAKVWIFCSDRVGDEMPHEKMSGLRETIERLVSLLPHQLGLIPCKFLCEMLRFAMAVEASGECRDSLEVRIGMQLEQASSKDLLLPCHGYANQEKYDTDCLKRIVMHFYRKESGLEHKTMSSVAELIDEFLSEIAADVDLKTTTFLEVAEFSIAASEGIGRGRDGIYRAVDVFLEKHGHLMETEREDVCRVLEWSKMSSEALEHAAVNERLPLRVVVQALFASQLKLREAVISKAVEKVEEEEEEEEDEMRMEMEKMGSKVSELERECFVMRREIDVKKKRHKFSMWREMKRKFGCMTTMHDCDCHVKNKKKKKVHPR